MRSVAEGPLFSPALVAAILSLSGCTFIGQGIGGSIDDSKPLMESLPGRDLPDLRPKTRVRITKTDSVRIEGTFLSLANMPADEFDARYRARTQKFIADSILPAPGQTVFLFSSEEHTDYTGSFVGFSKWGVHWRDTVTREVNQIPFESLAYLCPPARTPPPSPWMR